MLTKIAWTEPASLSGIYRYRESEIKILQKSPDQIQFDLLAVYRQGRGEAQVNVGSLCGNVKLVDSKADYKTKTYGDCEISLSFTPGKVDVVQMGSSMDCGFGFNVEATGPYRRVNFKAPPMDPCD